jgi:Ca2+-binding RTX toxin-like protein
MRTEVSQLYVALFGRAPDAEGLGYWTQRVDSGDSMTTIANAMYATDPARAYYPLFLTNQEIIASFYLNVLGRPADAEGLAYWTAALNASGATPGSVITTMINVVANYVALGGSDPAGLTSAALFNNKVAVAQYYGEHGGNIDDATTVLATVTADPATVTAAEAAIAAGTIGQNGIEVSLTANQDTIAGTTATDVVHGLFGAADATLTAGDTVDLAGGTQDQLALVADGTTAAPAVVIKNVEIINIQDTVGATFDELLVQNSPAINFTNTQAGLTSKVVNADLASVFGIAGTGNLTVDFASTSGTTDTAKVSLAGVGSSTVSSTIDVGDTNTVEAVSLATAGTNYVTLNAGTAAGTITVTGSGTNTFTIGTDKSTATIDASATTGTNTFVLGTTLSNGDVVKGGTGADSASFTANTAIGAVTFTGVETVTGTFNADMTMNLGTSTGITTFNDKGSSGSLLLNNATSDLHTVNIASTATGDTDNDFGIIYQTGQMGAVTVNLAGTSSVTMDEFDFTRVSSVTYTSTAGHVADIGATYFTGSPTVALNFTVGADSTFSGADINNDTGAFGDINATVGAGGVFQVTQLSASGGGIGNVNITVDSGGSAFFSAGFSGSAGSAGELPATGAHIGNVNIALASGATGSFYFSAQTGDMGDINMTVGADGSGYLKASASGFIDSSSAYVGGGNIGNINIDVEGHSGSAWFSASTGYQGGSIGNMHFTVNGSGASGYFDLNSLDWHSGGTDIQGDIGNVSGIVMSSGATLYGIAEASGNVGTITWEQNGANTSGYLSVSASGAIGDAGISFVGDGGSGEILLYAYSGNSGNPNDGEIGNVAINVGDDFASAYVSGWAYTNMGTSTITMGNNATLYASGGAEFGNVGAVTVTMGSGSFFSGWYSAGSGDMGAASIHAGTDSYVDIGVSGGLSTGTVNVVAGDNSSVYVYDTVSAGPAGGVTVSGGSAGDTGYFSGAGTSIDFINFGGWAGTYSITASNYSQGTTITLAADGGTVQGTQGADVITGGAGADNIYGNAGADVITGGAGNDFVSGGSGADSIDGGAGNDTLHGGGDNDSIFGGAGNDTIDGGAGNDSIDGGTGVDTMTGGGGTNVFVFSDVDTDANTVASTVTAPNDIITDFVSGTDKLDFTTAGSATNYSENLTDATTLANLMTAADTALDGTVHYYFGVVGTDGYLVYDGNGTGVTEVIKLTGVVDMAYTDIV